MSETKITFKEYQYFLDAKSDKSPLTIKQYKIVLDKFIKEMNIESVQKIESLKANEIRSYIMGLNGCANSKNGTIRVLKLFYNWLWKNDFIVVNSMIKIDRMKVGKKIIKMPTNEEMEIIYSNCDNPITSLMINFMSRMGLRRSELTTIEFSDISDDGRLLVKGKGNKQAVLKMPEDVFVQYKKYQNNKKRKESNFLFSYDGHKISPAAINIRISEFINSLPISEERKRVITPHSFRRRCGTNIYKKTQNAYAVKAILRHSSLSVGELYISPDQEEFDNVSMIL